MNQMKKTEKKFVSSEDKTNFDARPKVTKAL